MSLAHNLIGRLEDKPQHLRNASDKQEVVWARCRKLKAEEVGALASLLSRKGGFSAASHSPLVCCLQLVSVGTRGGTMVFS